MSDPQEAATPSDPHSAEAEAEYPYNSLYPDAITNAMRHSFDAGRVSRDAEVAELRAERDGLLQLREVAHWECDCVPDLGPTHCHACGDAAGHPVAWADSTHGPSTEVAELKAKIADAQAETIRLFGPPDDAATDSFGALSISLGAKLHAILGSASPHAVDDQMIRTTVAQLMDERDSWSPESVAYALEKAIRLTLDFGSASSPVEGGN